MRYPTGLAVRHNGLGIRIVLLLSPDGSSDMTVSPLR
jgi:hypothetical protein